MRVKNRMRKVGKSFKCEYVFGLFLERFGEDQVVGMDCSTGSEGSWGRGDRINCVSVVNSNVISRGMVP